jgi:hypothetical protein
MRQERTIMSSSAALVLGPWQLRHGEPVPASSLDLRILPLPEFDLARKSLVVHQRQLPCELFNAQYIPLAAIANADGQTSIAYLLHALDRDSALFHLIQDVSDPSSPLSERISQLFAGWHLRLNNNECHYAVAEPAESIRGIVSRHSYWTLGLHLHGLLDGSSFPLLRPQFRVPPRARHVDVEAYELDHPVDGGARYVLAKHYARRRHDWAQQRVTIETVSLTPSGLYRRHRTGELDTGSGLIRDKLADFVGSPVRPLAAWRSLSIEIPVEDLATGNVFTVSTEDVQLAAQHHLRRMFLRIHYEKTRGARPPREPSNDVDVLMNTIGESLGTHASLIPGVSDMLAEVASSEVQA